MLAIRLQRTCRKGHAQYRVIVQDSHRAPTSGKVVAHLGHYNPHSKEVKVDTQKAQTFLNNGAQPSDRVAKLLKGEGVKLPKWFTSSTPGNRTTRNPDKLRKNQTEQPAEEATNEAQATEEVPAETAAEVPAEASTEAKSAEPEVPAKDAEKAE